MKTRELVIVDESGRMRGWLGVDKEGQVALSLKNQQQQTQMLLAVGKNPDYGEEDPINAFQAWTPRMELFEQSGRRSMRLTASWHGNAVMNFFGPGDTRNLDLGYVDDGSDVGVPLGIWGMQVRKEGHGSTGIGVYNDPVHGGMFFISPVLDRLGRRSGIEGASAKGIDMSSPKMETRFVSLKSLGEGR